MPKEKSRPTPQLSQVSSHQRMNAALGVAPQGKIAKPPVQKEKKSAGFTLEEIRKLSFVEIRKLSLEELSKLFAAMNKQVADLNKEEFEHGIGRELIAKVSIIHKLLPKNVPTAPVKENLDKTQGRFNLPVNPIREVNAGLAVTALTPANTINHSIDVHSSSPRSKLSVC